MIFLDFAPHWSSSSLASSGEDLSSKKSQKKKSSEERHLSQELRKRRSLSRTPRTSSRTRNDEKVDLNLERELPPLPNNMAYDLK